MTTQVSTTISVRPAAVRRSSAWVALGVLALAQFMVFLDETVVNVALPSIRDSLRFSATNLAWVVNAYILVFGGLVLLGGRVGDLFGRRRTFVIGTVVFGVASLLDGLAGSQALLIGARGLQGVGAALATPAALALVTDLFPAGPERTKALGLWSALSGLGFAVGILLGGVITELASWRWVFLINVPVAFAAAMVVPRIVTASEAPRGRRLDVPGALTVTTGTGALAYALLEAARYGWTAGRTLATFAVATVLLAAFVVAERRSDAALVPPGFARKRMTVAPNLVQALLGGSLISTFFLLSLYLQRVLGYSPLNAGLAYLPLAASVAIATGIANKAVPRLGPRPVAGTGLAIAALGVLHMTRAPVGGEYVRDLLPALILLGLGAGLAFVSITTAALARVDEAESGLASGLLSTSVQLGGTLGISTLVAVASARTADLLATGSAPIVAQAAGLRAGFAVALAGALAASVAAWVGFESDRGRSAAPSLATSAVASS